MNPFLEFSELSKLVVSSASIVFIGLCKSLQSDMLLVTSCLKLRNTHIHTHTHYTHTYTDAYIHRVGVALGMVGVVIYVLMYIRCTQVGRLVFEAAYQLL